MAMGCTEPITYCASLVKDNLGRLPKQVDVLVRGKIIKNAKSVVVPNTNKGAGAGICNFEGGNANYIAHAIFTAACDNQWRGV